MKTLQRLSIIFILLLSFLLSACGREEVTAQKILVSIVSGEHFTVENNGVRISPGEDAVFSIKTDPGYSLTKISYSEDVTLTREGDLTMLTLHGVDYPTRVSIEVSSRYNTLIFDPNGGEGAEIISSWDSFFRPRPNTERLIFKREGFSLMGWNTKADGSGISVGLGSRITPTSEEVTLYAMWAPWSDSSDFEYVIGERGVTITGYHGNSRVIVIPESIDSLPVKTIAAGAFSNCGADHLILTESLRSVEPDAFTNCEFSTVTLYDSINEISDESFVNCPNLSTLKINAAEDPYGSLYRRESVYADKIDLLISNAGKPKMVFYGGCSTWYNLDGGMMDDAFLGEYKIVNLGLNGTLVSESQMEILEHFIEPGDIFIHTPELASRHQLLLNLTMGETDRYFWAGLENNYDLFSLVDIRNIQGVFDSLCDYLGIKSKKSDYRTVYKDEFDQQYMDEYGGIPFYRAVTEEELGDFVRLDPDRILPEAMGRLNNHYQILRNKGATVYMSYACINMDALPEDEKGNVKLMDELIRGEVEKMEGVKLISTLSDYIYHNEDFYDTNYHLLTAPARENTKLWIRDLKTAMGR